MEEKNTSWTILISAILVVTDIKRCRPPYPSYYEVLYFIGYIGWHYYNCVNVFCLLIPDSN
jgi:hypothetical protein